MGVAFTVSSIPLFSISPAFVTNREEPVALETGTGIIISLEFALYQVKSKPKRLLKKRKSRPNSVDVVRSGFRSEEAMVAPFVKPVCPASGNIEGATKTL